MMKRRVNGVCCSLILFEKGMNPLIPSYMENRSWLNFAWYYLFSFIINTHGKDINPLLPTNMENKIILNLVWAYLCRFITNLLRKGMNPLVLTSMENRISIDWDYARWEGMNPLLLTNFFWSCLCAVRTNLFGEMQEFTSLCIHWNRNQFEFRLTFFLFIYHKFS